MAFKVIPIFGVVASLGYLRRDCLSKHLPYRQTLRGKVEMFGELGPRPLYDVGCMSGIEE